MSSSWMQNQLDKIAVENFRDYLKIPTVHPDPNYDDAVKFLKQQATNLGLPVQVHYMDSKNPVVIITWKGAEPSLPSILLNSHMDVVPVFEEQWTYPPFEAKIDKNGNIYARGSQDVKCLGIQYLEAIRRMRSNGKKIKRTVHVLFVPDEEVGGSKGMGKFVNTEEFKAMNVGLALDEAMPNPTESFNVYCGERAWKEIKVHCPGNTGHASLLLDNTPGEKLQIVIDRFMSFRAEQKARLSNPSVKLGDVTSVNLTIIEGGVQSNVIPNKMTATFDVRLSPDMSYEKFKGMLTKWCDEAGEDVYYTVEGNDYVECTKFDDGNPYWKAFKKACDSEKMNLEIGVLPGKTDSLYIRSLGIPAINFTPMNWTKVLAHNHDEHLNVNVFLRGISIYMSIIEHVANF